MRIPVALLSIGILLFPVLAEDKPVVSIKQAAPAETAQKKSPVQKTAEDYCEKLSEAGKRYDVRNILVYGEKLLDISDRVEDPSRRTTLKIFALRELGMAELYQGKTKEALRLLQQAYSLVPDTDFFRKVDLAFLISDTFYLEDDIPSSTCFLLEGEKLIRVIESRNDKTVAHKLAALKYGAMSLHQRLWTKRDQYSELISNSLELMRTVPPDTLESRYQDGTLPDFYFFLGRAYEQSKNIPQAVFWLEKCIHFTQTTRTYHTKAFMVLADIYIRQKNLDAAEHLCARWDTAVREFPEMKPGTKENNLRWIKLFQAEIDQKTGQSARARKRIEEVLHSNPDPISLPIEDVFRLQVSDRKIMREITLLRRRLSLCKDRNEMAQAFELTDEIRKKSERLKSPTAKQYAMALFHGIKAQLYVEKNELQQAVSEYIFAYNLCPDERIYDKVGVIIDLCTIYYKMNDMNRCMSWLSTADKIIDSLKIDYSSPDSYDCDAVLNYWGLKIHCLAKEKRYKEALEFVSIPEKIFAVKKISLVNENAFLFVRRAGEVCFLAGDSEKSHAYNDKVCIASLARKEFEIRSFHMLVEGYLRRKDYPSAIRYAEMVLNRLDAAGVENKSASKRFVFYTLARIYSKTDNAEMSRKYATMALGMNPDPKLREVLESYLEE
ncbi:MAG: Tetratricopeptide repeat protein [Lentisphaerae bacterium ADurb.Bin242]|nr:MAG: Tetratricopeptide repeat protein [Lentisphaerae bacterium ADurb.Bin242]